MDLHEQAVLFGVEGFATSELLALALASTPHSNLVRRIEKLLADRELARLLQLDRGELQAYGLNQETASQLLAIIELARRLTIPSMDTPYKIQEAIDAVRLVQPFLAYLDHEEMRVLLIDAKLQVRANLLLYRGNIDTVSSRIAEIVRPAVSRRSPCMLLCHNHPSGDPQPSTLDIEFTEQLVAACKLLGIALIDHIIIGNPNYCSLKNKLRW